MMNLLSMADAAYMGLFYPGYHPESMTHMFGGETYHSVTRGSCSWCCLANEFQNTVYRG